MVGALHDDAIVIDGLIAANFSRGVFLDMRRGGLSDFGRGVIDEMNRVGILCDLSHVGSQSSEDVIRHSKRPIVCTHVPPAGLKAHSRNRSDAELCFLADAWGG